MTTLQERVAAHFAESILAKQEAEKVLVEPTAQAAELMLQCLMNDGKILACGNGGSAADAQHFAAEMTGRFEKERMELAAVALTTDTSALTAIGNDYGFDHVFSKQVRALGRAGDVFGRHLYLRQLCQRYRSHQSGTRTRYARHRHDRP